MNATTLRKLILSGLCTLLGAGLVSEAGAAGGTATNAPAKSAEIAKSTFVMPRDKREGRDPFHPNSSYPYDQAVPKPGGKQATAAPLDLVLKAITGTPGHRLATINTRTFGKDEDGEMTVSGSKVQIHILDILEDSVLLTVNGEQRELRFRRSFQ